MPVLFLFRVQQNEHYDFATNLHAEFLDIYILLNILLISVNHSISSIVCLLSTMVDLVYSNVMTSLL